MSRRKSYNPFRMWGSWIGMIIYTIIISYYAGTLQTTNIIFKIFSIPLKPFFGSNVGSTTGSLGNTGGYGYLLLIPIIGFLIGWGINSIFRRLIK